MASGARDVILSLDNVSCSIIFLNQPRKRDFAKEKQRTLVLSGNKDTMECNLEIYNEKCKQLLVHPVTFCGICQDTVGRNSKNKRTLNIYQRLELIFSDVTLIANFRDDNQKATKTYKDCLERCRNWFSDGVAKCVTLESHPGSCERLRGIKQVLLSVTAKTVSLSNTTHPFNNIVSWPLEQTSPSLKGEALEVSVAGNGVYTLTSKLNHSWIVDVYQIMQRHLRADATYWTLDESLFEKLTKDERIDEENKRIYKKYYTDLHECPRQPYSLDLNRYVTIHPTWYETVFSPSEENAQARYLTPLDSRTPSQNNVDAGYLTLLNSKCSAGRDVDAGYITTRAAKGATGAPSKCTLSPPVSDSGKQDGPFVERHTSTDSTLQLSETLKNALLCKPTGKDTLKLSDNTRFWLCLKLYLSSSCAPGMGDWKILGDKIGLTMEAIRLITAVVENHRLPYPAAELVLRHWQYVYNEHGETGPSGDCPHACTKENLIKILDDMNRSDLLELIQNDDCVNRPYR